MEYRELLNMVLKDDGVKVHGENKYIKLDKAKIAVEKQRQQSQARINEIITGVVKEKPKVREMNMIKEINMLLMKQLRDVANADEYELDTAIKKSMAISNLTTNILKSAEVSIKAVQVTGNQEILNDSFLLTNKK